MSSDCSAQRDAWLEADRKMTEAAAAKHQALSDYDSAKAIFETAEKNLGDASAELDSTAANAHQTYTSYIDCLTGNVVDPIPTQARRPLL